MELLLMLRNFMIDIEYWYCFGSKSILNLYDI